MEDDTEALRRKRKAEIDAIDLSRSELELRYGKVWDTAELQEDYIVEAFLAPYVIVKRKADGIRGSLEFQHYPRFYFSWKADSSN